MPTSPALAYERLREALADACNTVRALVPWSLKQLYYFAAGLPAWEEVGYPVEATQ